MEPTQRSAVRSGASEDPTTRPAPHPTVVVPDRLDPAGSWALADGRWHWGRPEISHDPAVLDEIAEALKTVGYPGGGH